MTRFARAQNRWRALPLWTRATIVVLAILLGLNVTAATVEFATGGPQPGGPVSSSYATAGSGSAAYATLLARNGHPVTRLRRSLEPTPAGIERTTLVVLDAHGVSEADARALRSVVRRGGRLITGDFGGDDRLLDALFAEPPVWSLQAGGIAHPIASFPETVGVTRVRSDSGAAWKRLGQTVPILTNGHGATATIASVGRGTVVLLADTSPLSNRLLARDDNALFGVAVAGEAGRPVVFDEAVHGYGEATGLRALPSQWKWALAILLAATVAWMIANGRRFGPPERAARDLPPARRAYVDAVAANVARTKQPRVAMTPARDAARAAVIRRAGLAPDADGTALIAAAQALGLSPQEADAVAHGSDDPMLSARALVHLTGARR
jgi:hypothetical protein